MPLRSPWLRPRTSFFAIAAAGLVLVLGLLYPSLAQAQITVPLKASLPRTDSSGKEIPKRDVRFKPEGISYQDCVDNQGIKFTLALPPPEANASLEAWASLSGADCTQQLSRTGASAVCWRLTKGIPLSINPTVVLGVRKIIGGRNNGRDTTKDVDEGFDGVDVCGSVDLTTITVQFLYFPPANAATASQKVDIPVIADTIGPVAPTGLTILPGNERLQISFDALGEGGVVELSTIRAYCDPNPGAAITTTPGTTTRVCDAAAAEPMDAADVDAAPVDLDAGCIDVTTEGGTSSGGVCSSAVFTSSDGGKIQPDNDFTAKYECGKLDVGATGSTIRADTLAGAPLENGRTYAVSLAATDSFLNIGPLSSVVCDRPEQTHDFWQDYVNAGGEAGGGFCSVHGPGYPAGSVALFGLALMFCASIWRRVFHGRRNGR